MRTRTVIPPVMIRRNATWAMAESISPEPRARSKRLEAAHSILRPRVAPVFR